MNGMIQLPASDGYPLTGRIGVTRTAKTLGFAEHDIPILTRRGLLKALGNPAANATRYFAACEILRLANDVQWLDRATRAVAQHWKNNNARRAQRASSTTERTEGARRPGAVEAPPPESPARTQGRRVVNPEVE